MNKFKDSSTGLDYLKTFLESVGGISNVHHVKEDQYGFSRDIEFAVFNRNYRIKWFHNRMTLYTPDGLHVMFTNISKENTWPIRAKSSLMFEIEPRQVVAFLKTEDYEMDHKEPTP